MIWACRQIIDMSTIHQRQAGNAHQASNPQEASATSGDLAFSVEPANDREREAQEIHATLQRCQGMIGAHEITSWRSQITVRKLSPRRPHVHDACPVHVQTLLYSIPVLRNLFHIAHSIGTDALERHLLLNLGADAVCGAGCHLWVNLLHHCPQVESHDGSHPIAGHVHRAHRLLHGQALEQNIGQDALWRLPLHATGVHPGSFMSCHPACTSQDPTHFFLHDQQQGCGQQMQVEGKACRALQYLQVCFALQSSQYVTCAAHHAGECHYADLCGLCGRHSLHWRLRLIPHWYGPAEL